MGYLLNNWIITLIGAVLGFKLPGKYLMLMRKKRKDMMDKQLEPALQQIATLHRINHSLELAVEQALSSIPSPLHEEFIQMLTDLRVAGMSLDEAMGRMAGRLDLPDFHFFTKVALLTQRYGGETRELMLHVPQTIRERQIIRAELETEIAGARQQAWLLMAGTPVFFIIYKILRPDFVRILTETAPGKVGMAIVALFSLISLVLIEKISEPVS
ncbi:MAG TPA: type II secretion system F family protein [Bacillota bacterium]|nr:type II secretion system F family protein [Bacillota bacterium]